MSGPRRPPAVLFLGYFGAGNLGDEAVLGVTLEYLRRKFPDLEAIVPGEDPGELARRYGAVSFPWQDTAAVIERLREVDLVVVGGGGLLHDYWPPRPETLFTPAHFGLTYHCGMGWLAGELGRPVALHAVGVGPLLYREGRDLVRAVSRVASYISVRDRASGRILEELGVEAGRVRVAADPAWLVEPAGGDEVGEILRGAGHGGGDWIAVALRNWDVECSQEQWETGITRALRTLSLRHGLGIVFLPFQHLAARLQDDVGLAERLAEHLRDLPVAVIREPLTPSRAMGVIGGASLLVGMRYHAVLFAAARGTPTVALAYDPKVSLLVEELGGVAEVLGLAGLEADEVVRAAGDVLVGADELRSAAESRRRVQRERALRSLAGLASLLEDPPPLVESARARGIVADVLAAERLAREAGTSTLFIGKVMHERAGEPVEEDGFPPRVVVQESRTVRLVAPSFFDPTGTTLFSGGAERYARELAILVDELGLVAEIVQPAGSEGWERQVEDLRVIGLGGLQDRFQVGAEAERRLPAARLTIHHGFYLAAGACCVAPAVGISHGIYWDDPAWSADPASGDRERSRALEAIRRLDLVVSVDANTINWVRARDPELAGKMVRIPNFVDLDVFRPRDVDRRGRRIVLYPRRLCAARGFWLMARVAPALLGGREDLEIHFVGDADPREAHFARSLVERYPGRVRWYVQPPDRMDQAYGMAEVVVIPTVAAEGTSLALLEAQASGRPVVCTAVGGLADLVIDGFNALVIEPSAAALEDAVVRLLEDRELARALAGRGRETAARFSLDLWRTRWRRILASYVGCPENHGEERADERK